MTVEQEIIAELLADPTVSAIVGSDVHEVENLNSPTLIPHILVARWGTNIERNMRGEIIYISPLVRVTLKCDDQTTLDALAEAVRDALEGTQYFLKEERHNVFTIPKSPPLVGLVMEYEAYRTTE